MSGLLLCYLATQLLLWNTVMCDKPPNIVIFLADDLGWNDVSYHGSEINTPTIDKLAHSGVRLNNYYVQYVCSPSRAALMSGRYPIHLGLQHEVIYAGQRAGLPLEIKTLAQQLKQVGYKTHAVGKWHMGFFSKDYLPVERGFDSFLGYMGGNEDYYTHVNCEQLGCGYDFYKNNNIDASDNGTYSTHKFTKRVHDIISNHSQESPLFLYVPYQAVHAPLQVPKSYVTPYEFITDEKRRIFAGMASCMDESIANITNMLKDYNMWNNTIIIFSTDNGGDPVASAGSNWPLRGRKWSLWEGGVKGTAFVYSPLLANRSGVVNTDLMHISDWYPTVLEGIVGMKSLSESLDGVNMWPSISQGEEGPRHELLHNIDSLNVQTNGTPLYNDTFLTTTMAAIRVGDWKLITGNPGDGKWYPPYHDFRKRHVAWLIEYLERRKLYDDAKGFKRSALEYDISLHEVHRSMRNISQFEPELTSKNIWLFNITADPEEIADRSADYPEIVRELLDRLAFYNKTALSPNFPSVDPLAAPATHNGFWIPWVSSASTWNVISSWVSQTYGWVTRISIWSY